MSIAVKRVQAVAKLFRRWESRYRVVDNDGLASHYAYCARAIEALLPKRKAKR